MKPKTPFSKNIIISNNVEIAVNEIARKLQNDVLHKLRRFGAVVGISGGIDSSVCLALAAKALGPEKVLGVMMPEQDSSA
jgi:NAD+ synthase